MDVDNETVKPGVNKMDAEIVNIKRKRIACSTNESDEPPSTKLRAAIESECAAEPTSKKTAFNVLDFSDEVLTEIFRNLDSWNKLSLMNAHIRFKILLCDRFFWNRIDLSDKPLPLGILEDVLEWSSPKTEFIKFHGPSPDGLGEGEIREFCKVMATSFKSICTNLRELELEHLVIDFNYLNILDFPKTLKRIMFRNCSVREHRTTSVFYGIDTHLTNLEELGIEHCDWFEPYFIMIISKVASLRWLSLQGCRQLAEFVPYGSMATRFGFKSLEYLDLRFTPLTDSDLQCFNVVRTLKEILLDCPEHLRRDNLCRAEAKNDASSGGNSRFTFRRMHAHESGTAPCQRFRVLKPDAQGKPSNAAAAADHDGPSTSRGCGTCGRPASGRPDAGQLPVPRIAQSGSVVAIVLEGAPGGCGAPFVAPTVAPDGDAAANTIADAQPDNQPSAQEDAAEPAAAAAAAPIQAEDIEAAEVPVVAAVELPEVVGPTADAQPAATAADAQASTNNAQNPAIRTDNRSGAYPVVISLSPLQGPRPDDVNPAIRRAAAATERNNATVARIAFEVERIRQLGVPNIVDNENASAPAVGDIMRMHMNNPNMPIVIRTLQRGSNPNNSNNNSNQQPNNGNSNQNANNNNNNNNNSNHNYAHHLDRVVRNPLFWDLIDPLARHAGGIAGISNGGGGGGAGGGGPPMNNPLMQLYRNLRMAGANDDTPNRSRYAFFRTAQPISDRGICCFGRPRHPVEHGVIWIRVGNRPAETNFERMSVRNYTLVTDTSLRHLVQCAPQLRFLDLSGTGVTRAGIEKFKRRKPACHIVAEHLRYDDGYESDGGDQVRANGEEGGAGGADADDGDNEGEQQQQQQPPLDGDNLNRRDGDGDAGGDNGAVPLLVN